MVNGNLVSHADDEKIFSWLFPQSFFVVFWKNPRKSHLKDSIKNSIEWIGDEQNIAFHDFGFHLRVPSRYNTDFDMISEVILVLMRSWVHRVYTKD